MWIISSLIIFSWN